MSVGIIRINGVTKNDLLSKLRLEIAETDKALKQSNRKTRRSSIFKKFSAMFSLTGALGISSVTQAYAMEPQLEHVSATNPMGLGSFIFEKLFESLKPNGIEVKRENTFMYQLTNYLTDSLFKTQDMFHNDAIVHVFSAIWKVVLSFSTLIFAKKGIDMIKSRTLGATTVGASDFIIRMLCSLVMSFFSLDIASAGVKLANLTVKGLMALIGSGNMKFDTFTQISDAYTGSWFWTLAFIITFVIVGLRYWLRNLNLLVLGVMAPVANMAWVTDGGAMLGTLIREFVVSLTTPIVQALTLALGTTMLVEVNSKIDAGGFVGFINTMLIGLSTCFLIIFTPEFLRKFIHGEANPVKPILGLIMNAKRFPSSIMRMIK
jgi:hypothetical protein